MATSIIKRGDILLGSIEYSNEASALGMEVVAILEYPIDGETVEQCESYESALRLLNNAYEAYCKEAGVTPQPRDPEPREVEGEESEWAKREAQELAEYEAEMARAEADAAADVAELLKPLS